MKKIGKYFFLLLFAIVFLILPCTCTSASSSLSDDEISSIRSLINEQAGNVVINGNSVYLNTYVVYYNSLGKLSVGLYSDIDYSYISNGSLYCHLNANGKYVGYKRYVRTSSGWSCDVSTSCNYDDNFADSLYDGTSSLLYANTALSDSSGNVFFQHAPLKGRILAAADREIQSNQLPHLLEIAKVVAIVLVSSILLLLLLPKLVKKSFRLLLR